MKSRNFLFTVLVACTGSFFGIPLLSAGQETIEVKTMQAQMSKGTQPCYYVEIPGAVQEDVQANWIKKLQENQKVKVIKIEDELVLADVLKTDITSDTISIYTLFITKDDRVIMNIFLEADSIFFSPNEDRTKLSAEKTDNSLKKYIRDFAVSQYKLSAAADLKAEQKILEDLEHDLEKLGKDNENLRKDITSLENDIDKTERNITNLEEEIEMKNQELIGHRTSMISLASEEDKKAARDKEKALDREKNKMEKERTNKKNNIADMESKIRKNEKTIEDNLKLMEVKTAELETQKEDVIRAQAFHDGIK